MRPYTLPFSSLGRHDVADVGGKNSSLGEMISNLAKLGVSVPDGFATTADAYREFLAHEGLAARIKQELDTLDVDDVDSFLGMVAAMPPDTAAQAESHGVVMPMTVYVQA